MDLLAVKELTDPISGIYSCSSRVRRLRTKANKVDLSSDLPIVFARAVPCHRGRTHNLSGLPLAFDQHHLCHKSPCMLAR